ncbi:hypothetical protein HY214_03875 [Candidatus Roizmanbacteria bacterium]|nr:hypothetical protein [Candidatus Roizmanbacteria bacterium]
MKAFFNAPFRGKKIHGTYYETIFRAIEKLGYNHLDRSIVEDNLETHYKKITEGGGESYKQFYDTTLGYLKTADVNIFECSFPSLGLGFQIEKSLEFNKPTIIIYLQNYTPFFLAGVKDEKLIFAKTTGKDVEKVLKKAFEEAKKRADKRFNFFISPYLLSYLNKVTKNQNITKSMFIRGLILEHMRSHQ